MHVCSINFIVFNKTKQILFHLPFEWTLFILLQRSESLTVKSYNHTVQQLDLYCLVFKLKMSTFVLRLKYRLFAVSCVLSTRLKWRVILICYIAVWCVTIKHSAILWKSYETTIGHFQISFRYYLYYRYSIQMLTLKTA